MRGLLDRLFKRDRIRPNDLVKVSYDNGYMVGRIKEYTLERIIIETRHGFDAMREDIRIEKVGRNNEKAK